VRIVNWATGNSQGKNRGAMNLVTPLFLKPSKESAFKCAVVSNCSKKSLLFPLIEEKAGSAFSGVPKGI
jgi:hypothetical protein